MTQQDHTGILFLSQLPDATGGAEISLLQHIRYLVSKNIRCHVIVSMEGEVTDELKRINVPFTLIPLSRWITGSSDESLFSPHSTTISEITHLIEKIKPRLCVTNTITTPWLAYAAAISNNPHSWVIREDLSTDESVRFAVSNSDIYKTIHHLSDKLFYNSSNLKERYLEYIGPHESGIIYPEITETDKTSDVQLSEAALNMLCVGRIEPRKDQVSAIKALSIVRDSGVDAHLTLLGELDPDYGSSIRKVIEELELNDHVTVSGFHPNPQDYMRAADMLIVCATFEAFGRVTIESMLSKTPVVGAGNSGTAEIITDAETGLLYKTGDPKDLAKKIIRLHKDSLLAETLVADAYDYVKKKFSAESCYTDFYRYYTSLSETSASSFNLSPLYTAVAEPLPAIRKLEATIAELSNELHEKQSQLHKNQSAGIARRIARRIRRG